MAVEAYQRLRGNTGPVWRDRLSSESRNLRAALDWYIAAGDPDAALSLASGIAWLWFINGNFAEGARWLGDALRAEGERRPQVAATAKAWHGYCLGMSSGPAAGVLECEEAVAALRPAADPLRLAEALELWAAVLAFSNHFDQSLQALHEAKELLDKLENGWLLATHDLVVAWVLLYLGRLDDAEPAARSSLERFDQEGEVLLVVSPLNVLARIAEARGDLHGASVAYEAVIERCRATGQALEVPFILVALATLRARQGDDKAADGLYAEAIGCCFNPWLSSDAMVGQAAVARRLGDLVRARSLLDEAGRHYPYVDFHAGPPRVLAGLAWWALASGQPDDAAVFAARAAQGASASGDPATLVLAETAVAAVQATVQPTPDNIGTIVALATRRAQATAYGSLTDGPDLSRPRRPPGRDEFLSGRPALLVLQRPAEPIEAGRLGSVRPELTSAPRQCHLRHREHPGTHADDTGRSPRPPRPPGQPGTRGRGPWPRSDHQPEGGGVLPRSSAPPPWTTPSWRCGWQWPPTPPLPWRSQDLAAVTEAPSAPPDSQQMSWERHHIEVVGTASTGDVNRALDLLREHLASVGCDPLAFRIVAHLSCPMGNSGDLDDIAGRLPACHATPWQCWP